MQETQPASLADYGIEVKTNRSPFKATCPKCSLDRQPHNQRIPCLTVWNEPDNIGWNCNHCGWKMNLTLLEKYKEVRASMNMPIDTKQQRRSPAFEEYFKKKGITRETLDKELVYEFKEGVIAYPYFHNRAPVNCKFRVAGEKKFWQVAQDKGTLKCYWGIDDILEEVDHAFIVEGECDVLTLKQLGYLNVLSVPDGAPDPSAEVLDKKFDFLKDAYTIKKLSHIKTFYLLTDNDAPGIFLRDYLANHYGQDRCKKFTWPNGYKDTNEVYAGDQSKGLNALGSKGVEQLVLTADYFPLPGLVTISDISDQLSNIAEYGYQPGFMTGNGAIDRLVSFKGGHTSVWTGVPGAGKSVAVRYLTVSLSKHNPNNNLRWGIFAPESETIAREATKTMQVFMEKQFLKGAVNSMNDNERLESKRWVNDHFKYILPTKKECAGMLNGMKIEVGDERSLMTILNYVKVAHDRYGLFGYVIDTWNRTDDKMPKGESETRWIGKMIDVVDEFNQSENLHGMIVAHPTKVEMLQSGNFKVPGLYNIYGSSNWKNKMYIGGIIHRDKYEKKGKQDESEEKWQYNKYAPTKFIIEKLKFEELGSEGSTYLWMDEFRGGIFVDSEDKIDYGLREEDHGRKLQFKRDQRDLKRALPSLTEDQMLAQSDNDFMKPEEGPLPF